MRITDLCRDTSSSSSKGRKRDLTAREPIKQREIKRRNGEVSEEFVRLVTGIYPEHFGEVK